MWIRVILITLEVISSVLLIGVILLQRSRSEGVGLAFGAGMGETLFGARAGNVLTRATIILAAIFMVNTLLLALVYSGEQPSSVVRGRVRTAPASRTVTPAPQPQEAEPLSVPLEPTSLPPLESTEAPAPTLPAAPAEETP